MIVLLGVAFVAGLVTAISPCVLPVLPIVLAGGATGGPRRPYAIVAGLVASFTAFTLAAALLLDALGLPDDLLRDLAIAVVLLVALSLLWPRLARLVERPFQALGRRAPRSGGGGFVLGVSLGLLFTPCAGPIIAAVATVAATERFTAGTVLITLAYALGAGSVLLAIAMAAQRGSTSRRFRERAPAVRRGLGVLMVAVAVLMILGVDRDLQTKVPDYVRALQRLEGSAAAQRELDELLAVPASHPAAGRLSDYGLAPGFHGIQRWLNSVPLSIEGLRGKVVLVDFWTYSCINCLRTIPYLRSWDEAYRDKGLVIVGVHTPEFAFEREEENVRRAVADLGIRYPVALDPAYATWKAWLNRYWPAEYFVDRRGHVRYVHFGEGEYEEKEEVIRLLLAEEGLPAPVSAGVEAERPGDVETPETYLGYVRLERYLGSRITPYKQRPYTFARALPVNGVTYGGRWTVEEERIVAGEGARLRLHYRAGKVFLVLGTSGEPERVDVLVDGRAARTIRVTEDRLYRLAELPGPARNHLLELRFSPGTEAYAFTFG